MTKISFEFMGLTLLEPMALILNCILAFQAWVYYNRLREEEQSTFIRYWRGFFLFYAISTFCGGLSHLFYHYWGLIGKIPGWYSGLLAISSMEWAMSSRLAGNAKKLSQYLVIGKFILSVVAISFNFHFIWVIVHSGVGLVFWVGIPSINGLIQGKNYLRFFVLGIVILLGTFPILYFKYDMHIWFNRDDFSHILMIMGTALLFQGIRETIKQPIEVVQR